MKTSIFSYCTNIIVAAATIFSLIGYLGDYHWLFDLFSHFKFQYVLILGLGIVILAMLKEKKAYLYLPFLLLNIYEVAPIYFGETSPTKLNATCKIVCINVLSSNRSYDAVKQYLNKTSADIIILQEFNQTWQDELASYLITYPHQLLLPRSDNFGMAIYSKTEFSTLKKTQLANMQIPSIVGDFKINGQSVKLLATHTLPPVGQERFNKRNQHLNAIAKYTTSTSSDLIVIGDLNTSSYSNHFKQLLSNSNLKDSRKSFGILPTWPTGLSLAYTTLDHCLVSENVIVTNRETGNFIGSDHLPIFVEIGLK